MSALLRCLMLIGGLSFLSGCVTASCPSWLTRPPYTEGDVMAMSDPMVEWTLAMDSKVVDLCR